jgi:hypothetical protein
VIVTVAVRYADDLAFALFAQTLAFVAFNKVVTAQVELAHPSILETTANTLKRR